MQRIKRLILLTIILLSSVAAWAQTDTSFWFAEPLFKNQEHRLLGEQRIFAYDSTDVTTETFYINNLGQLTSTIATASLHSQQEYGTGGGAFSDRLDTAVGYGYHFTATAPITTTFASHDHYTLKGANALGTHFVIPTPQHSLIDSLRTGIDIIATEDYTVVTIHPTNPLIGDFPGTHSVLLQRGQTYYVQAASRDPQSQLGGSIVTATRPIAVNSTAIGCKNNNLSGTRSIGDQLIPTRLLGTQYIVPGTPSDSTDFQLAIYAIHPNTHISINGIELPVVLDSGDNMRKCLGESINLVASNQPIALFLTHNGGWFSGAVPPPTHCSGSNQFYFGYTHSGSSEFTTIVVPSADTAHFSIDGDTPVTLTQFQPIGADSTLSWGTISGTNNSPFISHIIANPSRFHVLRKYTFEQRHNDSIRLRYGMAYYTDFVHPKNPHLHFDMPSHYCEGDTIQFVITQSGIDTVVLSGPYGLNTNQYDTLNLEASTHIGGWYYIQGYDTNACHQLHTDSIYITIHTPYYGEDYDTIAENQLPWEAHGATFTQAVDTLLVTPSPALHCDSTINYHLFVYPNITDTILYYLCDGDLPLIYEGDTLNTETSRWFHHTGCHGEDSNVVVVLHVNYSSEASVYDTIVDIQLPWYVFDTVFNDSVDDYLYSTYNEVGCDSLIHYYLHVWWNGDHCDTTLEFYNVVTPNGDGKNDKFVIGGLLENNCFKYSELIIYSRAGQCVYRKSNIADENDWWDPAADRIPDGTYFYVFKAHGVNIKTLHRGVIEVISKKQ